jgi:protein gp37
MAGNSKIEWTHHTFNPWWGCTKVSPGCDHCYAERDARRFVPGKVLWGVDADRREFGDKHWNMPLRWNAQAARSGERALVFCASMADAFDKHAPDGARSRLWNLIKATPHLTWQILTKRIGNAYSGMLPMDFNQKNYPNVWLGISVVNQEEADRDIPKLLGINAAVHWLSMEPLLGDTDISQWLFPFKPCRNCPCPNPEVDRSGYADCCKEPELMPPQIDWVVTGGESGPNARPMHPDWPRRLRDQCAAAGVPFLFKQWGEWAPHQAVPGGDESGDLRRGHVRYIQGTPREPDGRFIRGDAAVARIGKKAAGRLLDGVQHDGYPK